MVKGVIPLCSLGLLLVGAAPSHTLGILTLTPESSFVGGPIGVRLTISNDSDQIVSFDLGHDHQSAVQFIVTDENGQSRVLNWTEPRPEGGIFLPGKHSLAPGEKFSHLYILEELGWDGDSPGTYRVELRLEKPIFVGGRAFTGEADVTLEVVEDEDALAQYCRVLAEEALSRRVSEATAASRRFAYVKSPVCLRYVAEVAVKRPSTGVIKALGQIGTPEAVQILITALQETDEYHAHFELVRELRMLHSTTESPELWMKIQRALQDAVVPADPLDRRPPGSRSHPEGQGAEPVSSSDAGNTFEGERRHG